MENRSFDDEHFKKMIIQYLQKLGKAKRSAIDALIIPKLSTILSDYQKKNKVMNMLTSLRSEGKIKSTSHGTWELI
ncbi:MAG: ATP-dependent DNA helicase RecG [Rickettsiales bacterium]|jgi:ATP-dependent DNA helicase RecG